MKKKSIQKGIIGVLIFILCFLYVPVNITQAASLKLNQSSIKLARYHKYKLKVNGTKKKATWHSKNKLVASVNKKGVVTAESEGTTIIYAKVGSKKLSCKVKVIDYKPVEEMAAYGYCVANKLFQKEHELKISDMRTSTFMEGTEFAYFKCSYKNSAKKSQTAYFYIYPKTPDSLQQINLNTKRYGNLVVQIDNYPMEQMMMDRSNKLKSSRVKDAYRIFSKLETIKPKKGSEFNEKHRWLKL